MNAMAGKNMSNDVCILIGAGPGTGDALARRFAREGYRLALVSRSGDHADRLAGELDQAQAFRCDATDPDALKACLGSIRERMGPAGVLLYNAGQGQWGTIDETGEPAFEQAWRLNALGLLTASRAVIPDMRDAGRGSIIVTGATASLRGGARFTAFASAKAAQKSLAESMARHLGPDGIHVALMIIDGVIDTPRTREMLPDKPDGFFLQPAAIAETAWQLVDQPPSAWSFRVDLRPHGESF